MEAKPHWDNVYASKRDDELSWSQPEPTMSLNLIVAVAAPPARVLDVGGGTSLLAQRLIERGFHVGVLDISAVALERAKVLLGPRAAEIRWIVADVAETTEVGEFDVWHDRAVFHFLTESAQRAAYVALLARTVPVGGHAVIATFAPDGPEKCSGLPVRRYSAQSLAAELGASLELLKGVTETHSTPWGKPQTFQYSLFKRL